VKVLIIGLPLFSKKLAEDLNKFDGDNIYISFDTYYSGLDRLKFLYHLPSADIVYSRNGSIYNSKAFSLTLFFKKKLMMQWVGTDVIKSTFNYKNNQVNYKFIKDAEHFCGPEWLRDELKNIEIDAELLTINTFGMNETLPRNIPSDFSILSYIGTNREEFYGIEQLIKLSKDFPDIQFHIVGIKNYQSELPNNVKLLGWVDNIVELYKQNVLFLRLTKHDGLSNSVLEALSVGNYVAWTCNFPHTFHVTDYENLKNYVTELKQKFENNELSINDKGIEYVKSNFNKDQVLTGLISKFNQVLKNA